MPSLWLCLCDFFFFKQKTAYEMRISDWSSDVCSSDLGEIATQSGERLLADSRKRLLRHGRLGAGGTLPQHGLLALQLGHRRCVQAVRFPERRPASIHARMIEPTRLAGVAQDRPEIGRAHV